MRAVGTTGIQELNDTLLWGGQISFAFEIAVDGDVLSRGPSQLVKVAYERPTTWLVQVVVDLATPPAGETATYDVFFDTVIGVGKTSVTLKKQVTFAPVAGVYPSQLATSFEVPAQAIQIGAELDVGRAGVTRAGPHNVTITALVAPIVE
jgi:hypothetical protein